MHTKKILVPIDFSQTSFNAIKHAAFIARASDGELILLHIQKKNDLLDIIVPLYSLPDSLEVTKFLQNGLEKQAAAIRKEFGIGVTTVVRTGHVASGIVSVAEEHNAGMIIMGTLGRDSNNDFFLGSNCYRVLTKSHIPVMAIRSEVPKIGYSTILLPIDSSLHSRQKVNSALSFANKFKAKVHVLGLLGKNEDNYEYKMKVILPQIHKMATTENVVCNSEIEKTTNRSERTLLCAKEINADLIIIMSDQKSELSGVILGTYAHQLINNSDIPVLCIPPEMHPENFPIDSLGGMW